jgi:hypothetical protein
MSLSCGLLMSLSVSIDNTALDQSIMNDEC